MADILKFDVTCSDLLALAEKARSDNDVVKQVDYLKRALKLDPKCGEASLELSKAYAGLFMFDISNDVAFRALGQGVDEELRQELYVRLATNYLQMDNFEVAEYYVRDYEDDIGIDYPEQEQKRSDLKIVYPHDEEYYDKLIAKAYALMSEGHYDDAISLMDEVEPGSKSKESANQIVLTCLTLKNDMDAVIENARRMLKQDGDSLVVKCTLATAYMMEDRMPEARELVQEILSAGYTHTNDILLILPLLVNLELHSEIVKYTQLMLKEARWQPNTMLWLAIALFNLGQKDEAIKVVRRIDILYGDEIAGDPVGASYFLELFETATSPIEYTVGLPKRERLIRARRAEELLRTPSSKLSQTLESDSPERDEILKLLRWVFNLGEEELMCVLARKLTLVGGKAVDEFFKSRLLRGDLSYELLSIILVYFMDSAPIPAIVLDVVAQDRFKHLAFLLPPLYYAAPKPLRGALKAAIVDIVFTDEEPNLYISDLFAAARDLVQLDEEGKPIMTKRLQKICKLKSFDTMVGVLLGKVYEEDETREEIIDRYGLVARTYDKYWKIFFGDDDDGRED